MKAQVNNQSIAANVVINEKMLNEKFALKYISKGQMIEECNKLAEAIGCKPVKTVTLFKQAYIDLYREMVKKANEPAPAAEPVKKEEKKASKKDKGDNSAQARLDNYTSELKEKTDKLCSLDPTAKEYKEEAKALKHRIASLKRKIARAEKALKPHFVAA